MGVASGMSQCMEDGFHTIEAGRVLGNQSAVEAAGACEGVEDFEGGDA